MSYGPIENQLELPRACASAHAPAAPRSRSGAPGCAAAPGTTLGASPPAAASAGWFRQVTTYQSSDKLAQAAEIVGVTFDLVVLDEAHRTVGARHRDFVALVHDHKLKANRRLFMTATEKRFRDGDIETMLSMDDNVDDYGARFYTMSFKEAIEHGIITHYQIFTIFVKESDIEQLIKENKLLNLDEGLDPVAAIDVATAVATKRVIEQKSIKHPLVFNRSIRASTAFRDQLNLLNDRKIGPLSENFHVDSTMSAGKRKELLDQFI
jgi:predicted helicase